MRVRRAERSVFVEAGSGGLLQVPSTVRYGPGSQSEEWGFGRGGSRFGPGLRMGGVEARSRRGSTLSPLFPAPRSFWLCRSIFRVLGWIPDAADDILGFRPLPRSVAFVASVRGVSSRLFRSSARVSASYEGPETVGPDR